MIDLLVVLAILVAIFILVRRLWNWWGNRWYQGALNQAADTTLDLEETINRRRKEREKP